jgi:hypothetical protein
MKQLVMFGFILYCLAYMNGKQAVPAKGQLPKQVVEEFCKFEIAGGRLTESGWNKAGVWFVPSTPATKICNHGY